MVVVREAPPSNRRRGGARRRVSLFEQGTEAPPLRAELLSVDQLERHGRSLSHWHHIRTRRRRDQLLPRLAENERILEEAGEVANAALRSGRRLAPAAEWLIDNYYVVESQVRLARQHLPRRYSRELPQLSGGSSDGLPRVYDIAMELIIHADGKVDTENVRQFVGAYQSTAPLDLGELWAVPIMLRLALIENLRRIAVRAAWQQRDRDTAAHWAERVLESLEHDPKNLIVVLADAIRAELPMSASFVAEYAHRVQGRSQRAPVAMQWLEERLAERGQTVERLVQLDTQEQAADQVSMGNTITSLRSLGAMDWREFVEDQSRVERILRTDPAGSYDRMTFATRDQYRHVVEEITRRSSLNEAQVARAAIELAQESRRGPSDERADRRARDEDEPIDHVGYYLVDEGRRRLERTVGYRPSLNGTVRRLAARVPLAAYLGGLFFVWTALLVLLTALGAAAGLITHDNVTRWLAPLGLAALWASQPALALVNWLCLLLVRPRPVSQLDFSRGVPRDCRTIVVVPTMLTSSRGVESLIEQMEIRFLANREEHLHFALLTDFADAPLQTLPQDQVLLDLAREGVDALNQRYAAERGDRFFLFHRPRQFNASEGVWMGRERKRGKLADFNAFLTTGRCDAFQLIEGDTQVLTGVRYAITLDTDTQLPRDAAHKLIGAMAHPLNRPRFDDANGRAARGYAILQPRVAVTVPDRNVSRYSRLFGGDAGIDPYTAQVSDVYQDLFGNGSFIGKGIYDLHAFERALCDRFPDNRILSHDLIESCHAHSGLVSDIELFEGFPSRYLADASRRHRWVRGDWQLLAWITRWVPGPRGRAVNPTTWLGRWKLFDNLRRSTIPALLLAALVAGWVLIPGAALFWTAALVGLLLLPDVISAIPGFVRVPDEMPLGLHLRTRGRDLGRRLAQTVFQFAVLPYEAHWNLDAIVRTLFRLFVSRRRLLEWTTASDAERRAAGNLRDHYELMYACVVVPLGLLAALVFVGRAALPAALPVLALWGCGPWLAWMLSQPLGRRTAELTALQRTDLRRVARLTWHYFDTFATERENWLAPDNFQEHPTGVIAARTSPTNIGMGLTACLAAWDFGYVSTTGLAERIARTLATLDQLDRFHGHFYNWYDTRTLEPIHPRYISSVDSGNLAGLLLTLRGGLETVGSERIVRGACFDGLADTLEVALRLAKAPVGETPRDAGTSDAVLRIERIMAECRSPVTGLSAAHHRFSHLADSARDLVAALVSRGDERTSRWIRAFEQQCREFDRELLTLAPWLTREWAESSTNGRENGPTSSGDVRSLLATLDENCALADLPRRAEEVRSALVGDTSPRPPTSTNGEAAHGDLLPTPAREAGPQATLVAMLDAGIRAAVSLLQSLQSLASRCESLSEMDFQFLYDRRRDLLAIGYNVSERRMDASFYDLLASEARLASFLAIAQGQLPREHWFALGRMLTTQGGEPTLLSWSGSMFEYLMPLLVMPQHEGTLLDLACRGAVARQIQYGRQNGVPWGVSESCYNVTDVHMTYQYRAFGVPGLGLQRGLGEDLVIAPYAAALALMVAPGDAAANLKRMEEAGWLGDYGFFEAIDHTPARRGPDNAPVPCRNWFAHHGGMTLLSLVNVLLDHRMQRRFLSDPQLKAHDLLLQERVPGVIRPVVPHPAELRDPHLTPREAVAEESSTRNFTTPDQPAPEVHLLGNGKYHVMLTQAGGGFSEWEGISLNRWDSDPTCDALGQFCYVRDVESNEFWSTTHQPTARKAESYFACFAPGRAEFRRIDDDLDVQTTVGVSPEEDIEVRRVVVKNIGRLPRSIDLTTYAEVVLASRAADVAHRAFSNLFITTELLPDRSAILCTRRPRAPGETHPVLFHLLVCDRARPGQPSFETDRARFLGRGRGPRDPQAMRTGGALGNSSGAVLDPIVSIRRGATLAAEECFRVDLVTGVAPTRDAAIALIEKYQDFRLCDRVFELSWTHDQVVRRQLQISDADVQIFSRLATPLLYGRPTGAAGGHSNPGRRNQSHLWSYGIGGDLPIVLVKMTDLNRLNFARRVLQAHAFWSLKGLRIDLVLWNEESGGYRHSLHDALMGLVSSGPQAALMDRPGGIFVRRSDQMPDEDRLLLECSAAVVLSDAGGSLREQIGRRRPESPRVPLRTTRPRRGEPERDAPPARRDLLHYNGTGGFTADGKEYVIRLRPGEATPAPWCNVLANDEFGTVVSESNLGYTWFANAHEFRLTPWRNDSVIDPAGEALYVRDEETGRYFSPTPEPARGARSYVVRHGFGYSVWEYQEGGLHTELTAFVVADAPVKVMLLRVRNASGRRRTVSATGYVEWTLGERRLRPGSQVVTEIDSKSGAILARDAWNREYGAAAAFFQSTEVTRSLTTDRAEFLGRHGDVCAPAAMRAARLSGRVGAGLDPCAAIQNTFDLNDGEEREVAFLLGAAESPAAATALLQKFQRSSDARRALEAVWRYWEHTLSAVRVETPDTSVDVLSNGWLLYQTLACRFRGRSGFYQSGGAYGFRDQLQDSLAFLHSVPAITRSHLLRCAARQFREGDVQHWWHPPQGRGVRTRFSDDFLWLPFATAHYVGTTGDTGVLSEAAAFLSDRSLAPGEEAYYGQPQVSDDKGDLYEHCRRAILNGLRFGPHGLPLMGCGDWNDGMNLVGIEGRGESVWLAFFLIDVLTRFAPLSRLRSDDAFAERCLEEARKLREKVEEQAWDGEWYRRAWFDDGRVLGSRENSECRIDALPQAWSVIAGGGPSARARTAMESVSRELIRRDIGLIPLFTPPFDKSDLEPGYIKGYLPGVRENGGQYTHAAVWTAMAFALLGDADRAWECLAMINPVSRDARSRSAGQAIPTAPPATAPPMMPSTPAGGYKVEPYVVAADVYSVPPHEGRGGWTWYTGSAGWTYRLLMETLLGLRLEGGTRLWFQPCVPAEWPGYSIDYRFRNTHYRLEFMRRRSERLETPRVTIHDEVQATPSIPLVDDGGKHDVRIEF